MIYNTNKFAMKNLKKRVILKTIATVTKNEALVKGKSFDKYI